MFTFRLAERLGRTVAELEETMSNREFIRWVALAGVDQLRAQADEQRARARGGRRGA